MSGQICPLLKPLSETQACLHKVDCKFHRQSASPNKCKDDDDDGHDHHNNVRTIIVHNTKIIVESDKPLKQSKFFTVTQMNDPANYKLGVIVDLHESKARSSGDDNLAFVEIDGKLRNIGNNRIVKDFTMSVILYDSANHTIASDLGTPNITKLRPGDSSPFFVWIGGKDAPLDGITTKEKLKEIDHIVYLIEEVPS